MEKVQLSKVVYHTDPNFQYGMEDIMLTRKVRGKALIRSMNRILIDIRYNLSFKFNYTPRRVRRRDHILIRVKWYEAH